MNRPPEVFPLQDIQVNGETANVPHCHRVMSRPHQRRQVPVHLDLAAQRTFRIVIVSRQGPIREAGPAGAS